jgi:glycosyltransferase involved in cell wall biosynthesis
MSNLQISVVIPSFNQGQYIERTLLSILKQEYKGEVQIIVSDGASTDNTVEILKKYDKQITWWSEKDNGYADAVNKGFGRATGEIFAIQSSDDYYLKDAFQSIIDKFSLHPDASLICGREVIQNPDGRMWGGYLLPDKITPESFLIDHPFPGIFQHTTFFKRDYFEKTGGLRDQFDMCADADLFYRLLHFANGYFLDRYIGVYQRHGEQRTQTQTLKFEKQLLEMVQSCHNDPAYNKYFDLTQDDYLRFENFITLFYMQYVNREEACFKAKEIINSSLADKRTMVLAQQLIDASEPENRKAFSFNSFKLIRIITHLYRKYIYDGEIKPEKEVIGTFKDEINSDWWKN